MNRYFFYNFMLVSLMNLMLFVPHILVKNRYSGGVSSLLVAPVIGAILIYMFTNAMTRYPGLGFPEIMKLHCPRWLVSLTSIFFAVMWWFSSTIVVVAYAVLINRFFNPDANTTVILIMMVIAAAYAASRSTLTIAFIIEIGIIVNAPIILFILFKMVRSPQLNFDAIRVVANHVMEMPTIITIAAATLIFTGYIHLALFNRLFPPNFRFKHLYIYPILGFVILLITFFVPIGFHGTEGVDRYIYLWAVTSDSLSMQYGFIERVMFLFLIVFLNLTLVYTMSGWHLGMEYIKSCFKGSKPEIDSPKAPKSNYIILGVFATATVLYLIFTNEKINYLITSYWLVLRMFTEVVSVLWVFILSRRRLRPE
ncbi:GerAB/ArcD/ProY family transporter [Paenibacillus sp. NPDC057967]|uniref:GerAB/ArcD/ProY family transporter n=1 Tax=Paenibacillus sp. NPDC057967 TaxID=3346293 RepID=UPI0036D8908E